VPIPVYSKAYVSHISIITLPLDSKSIQPESLTTNILKYNMKYRLHSSKMILAHEEKFLFLIYLWRLNSNMFPEFLYHPHLSLQVKGLESSEPGH